MQRDELAAHRPHLPGQGDQDSSRSGLLAGRDAVDLQDLAALSWMTTFRVPPEAHEALPGSSGGEPAGPRGLALPDPATGRYSTGPSRTPPPATARRAGVLPARSCPRGRRTRSSSVSSSPTAAHRCTSLVLGVLDREAVEQAVAVVRAEPLDHPHALASQVGHVAEVRRLDDQRVPFPPADRISGKRGVVRRHVLAPDPDDPRPVHPLDHDHESDLRSARSSSRCCRAADESRPKPSADRGSARRRCSFRAVVRDVARLEPPGVALVRPRELGSRGRPALPSSVMAGIWPFGGSVSTEVRYLPSIM